MAKQKFEVGDPVYVYNPFGKGRVAATVARVIGPRKFYGVVSKASNYGYGYILDVGDPFTGRHSYSFSERFLKRRLEPSGMTFNEVIRKINTVKDKKEEEDLACV